MATVSHYSNGSADKKFKMALLGITGSGKTSLIDLIHNYASLSGCKVESLKPFSDKKFEAESEPMESKTNVCVPYSVTVKGIPMEIIDTPGLQDSRGKEKSQENIKNIILTLKNGKYVNCICLVMNGRLPRLDLVTQQAISDILGILPQEMKKNTIVVYTNVVSRKDLTCDHTKIKSELEFASLKPFMLDNVYCIKCKLDSQNKDKTDLDFSDEAAEEDLGKSLEKNVNVLDSLFKHILPMSKISTDNFGYLRHVSEEIKRNCNGLKALEKTKENLDNEIQNCEKKLQKSQEGVRKLKSQLEFIQKVAIPTVEYNTLCEADGCFSNCHAPCIYTGMFSRNVKECVSIKENGFCKICGHHYTSHVQSKCKYDEKKVQLRSSLIKDLENAETKEDRASLLLSEREFQLRSLQYSENRTKMRSEIAILLADIQRITSDANYEKVIDRELILLSKFFGNLLSFSQKDLTEHLGLTYYRQMLIEIQNMPYGEEMSNNDKRIWACKILDIDSDQLTESSVHRAVRERSGKYMDVIKEGDDVIMKRQTHALKILLNELN